MSFQYKVSLPENTRESYGEYDNIDFVLDFPNEKLRSGSLRILADVEIENIGGFPQLDCQVGGHTFFSDIITTMSMKGQVEHISEYPRYVKMDCSAKKDRDEMISSQYACELRTPDDKISGELLKGVRVGLLHREDMDFSIAPLMCLNNVEGQSKDMSYMKTGSIRVSLRCERKENVLFGSDWDISIMNYKLKNVRLSYITTPEDGQMTPQVMRTKTCITSKVDSSFVNISSKVPAVSTGMSASFLRTSRLGSSGYNTLKLEEVPSVSRLEFLFNDTINNSFITFDIDNNVELTSRYLESMTNMVSNDASLLRLASNDAWGIGVNFGRPYDLSQTRFSTQIQSQTQTAEPYEMFLYFHCLTTL